MAVKPVACEGDASATPGTTLYAGAQSGTWTAGPVSPITYDHLTVGGVAVLAKASCEFSFSGTSGNTAVTGSSTVTLSPSATVLQYGGANVLRDGNSADDEYGNTLSASSARALASA